jgi:hypothetical protein
VHQKLVRHGWPLLLLLLRCLQRRDHRRHGAAILSARDHGRWAVGGGPAGAGLVNIAHNVSIGAGFGAERSYAERLCDDLFLFLSRDHISLGRGVGTIIRVFKNNMNNGSCVSTRI